MHSVLFVCTANICRSPIAMGLWQAKVSAEAQDWRIESAGVRAMVGSAPAKYSAQVLQERGIDISAHRARQVTAPMLAEFNLILVMEQNHKQALRAAFPALAERVYLLTEMIQEVGDIADPIGGERMDYQQTAREIELILSQGYERIVLLSQKANAIA